MAAWISDLEAPQASMQEMTFLVNFLFGQKHLASLLDVHLGARLSQVLMHWGTVLGQGAEGAGLELEAGEVPVEPGPAVVMVSVGAVEVEPAEHLVQMVEVEVKVTVETVLVGTVMVEPPEVMVLVTGQVVTVVYVMRVVVDSSGGTEVEPADTLEGTGVGGAVVTPAEHFVQMVEVEVRVTVDTVLVGTVMVEPPEVMVFVTGHVVTVVYVTRVVVDSSGPAGVEPAATLEGTDVGAVVVTPAEHLVQIVEVEVRVTVDTVLVGTVRVDPPVVIVLVTGHVVTVVYVTRVVVDSSGMAGVEPAETLEGTDGVGIGLDTAGLDPAGTDPAGVDSAGGVVPPGTEGAGVVSVPGTVVTPAEHLVQIVEVEVIVTVEMVLEVVTM